MAAIQNSLRHYYVVIASWCGRQRAHFQTYYVPSKSRSRSFYIYGVTEGVGGGGGIRPYPPLVEDQKKPGLNRVNPI